MFQFIVEYAIDHEAMAAAQYRTAYVTIAADNAVEASLLAAQMVGATHGIPTATQEVHK